MTNDEKQLLAELEAKSKLGPKEKAQLKNLKLQLKKEKAKEEPGNKISNVFGTEATTTIKPLPIRFSSSERAGITTRGKDIKANNKELIITKLGREGEVNDTKLIRAAVLLMQQHTDEEIIDAIQQVKLNMIR